MVDAETLVRVNESLGLLNDQLAKTSLIRIAFVALDDLELLQKNARYMANETFRNLVENICKDGGLSQIPFCMRRADGKYLVLSGNHRVMGAREAELEAIPVLWVDECDVSRERQIATRDRQEEERVQSWICQIVASAQARRFWGDVTLEFREGVLKFVRQTETLIPPK